MTLFGRNSDRSHSDLARAAVTAALQDAGIRASDLGMEREKTKPRRFFGAFSFASDVSLPDWLQARKSSIV